MCNVIFPLLLTTSRLTTPSLPSKLQYTLFQSILEGLTLAVVYWLCCNLVFGAMRLDGVGHLRRVGGKRNPLQVVVVYLDIIRR